MGMLAARFVTLFNRPLDRKTYGVHKLEAVGLDPTPRRQNREEIDLISLFYKVNNLVNQILQLGLEYQLPMLWGYIFLKSPKTAL